MSLSESVTLFATCIGDLVTPETVEDVERALQICGCNPTPATGTTCCGQPAFNAGFHRQARAVARVTARALAATRGPIVVPAGSCAAMMYRHWPELFSGDRDEQLVRAVARRVVEFTAVLADHCDELRAANLHLSRRVGYHDSCHMLRELGLSAEPRAVLGCIDGLELVALPSAERCCGFGGTFAVRYPEVSVAMADSKLDDVVAEGIDMLVSADAGCIMQLGSRAARAYAGLRVVHIATVLREAGLT